MYQRVKNIARPVRVYRVAVGPAGSVPLPAPTLPSRPSIAVLPLDNLSADPEQEYFADGLTEDLITYLSKIAGLPVRSEEHTSELQSLMHISYAVFWYENKN